MSELSNRIVQKLWSYCNVLRDDGCPIRIYLEQLTFILFLKMADERAAITGEKQAIPRGYRWADLANPAIEGVRLEEHYRETLRKLGEAGGMLVLILRKAQNKIQGSGEDAPDHRRADREGRLATSRSISSSIATRRSTSSSRPCGVSRS